VELAPHHAISLGYRGDARLRTGDRAGGKADLRRALELDPEYVFARRCLVDVHLEDGELDQAQQALQAAAAVPGDDSRRVQWLRLQMKRGHKTDAAELLRDWLADPQLDPGWLEPALSELGKHGWQDAVDAAAAQAVAAPTCHPAVARVWIAPFAGRGDFKACAERLRRLAGRDALLVPALILFLESAGRGHQRDAIDRVLKQHRELVERDASLWGTAGYAFVELGDHVAARRWLQGWAKRPGVLPWMLYNLVLALTRTGEWDQAISVSRGALTLTPDHTTNDHVAWLLAEQALGRDPRPAEASARRLDGVKLDQRFEFLRTLAVGVLGLRRSLGFAWFQAEVVKAEAVMPAFAREPDLRRAYVRSVWRAARGQRRLRATLWAFFRVWRAERGAPIASLLGLLKERPLEVVAPPPPQRVAAPLRRRSSDA
jgi:tetratricopeptide (TPR) repeat protein